MDVVARLRPPPRSQPVARLRAGARGRDGGVRQELAGRTSKIDGLGSASSACEGIERLLLSSGTHRRAQLYVKSEQTRATEFAPVGLPGCLHRGRNVLLLSPKRSPLDPVFRPEAGAASHE